MRLQDKVVVLGGVGAGMGRAMALLFAQEGGRVVLAARKPELIGELQAQIEAGGGQALAVQADMTAPADVERLFETAVATFGQVNAFCAQAGGFYKHLNNLTEIEPEFFDLVLHNHIKSIFYGVRAAVPHLKAAGGGAIVTISAGYKTRRDANIAYGTAKEGVIGFSKNLARELKEANIRVNCIAPGLIRLPSPGAPIRPPQQSLTRLGQPEDIAYAALYLIAAESAWLTGQTLVVDGGDEVYGGVGRDLRWGG